ncbi:hypothetical protein GXP67_35705 [Rhodocytophaga rosea]|uniref:Uncharacterized protein n=1 Tax=Rhodocytophaga rosea TaxID=2704465 RepID=A0A6C0GTX9_9BACT|nr:hypothetical protein [Rhodocytophaga rosea]QHT71639.1 hypothetical protein GXP67_35705 [Rhodocytophaga rosea]
MKIQFISASNNSNNYENVSIYIYSLEDQSTVLAIDHPDNKGKYSRKLLQGNYTLTISFPGGFSNPAFQLIGGETHEIKYTIQ